MTQRALLLQLTAQLQNACVPDAAFEAKELLYAVLQTDATGFLLHQLDCVSTETINAANTLVQRRIGGEPLQYLLGQWDFLDESFLVGPGVLIPRPETEDLVLQCEILLRDRTAPVIYDLCAGSGCIGLTLQKRVPYASVFLIEKSPEALHYLRCNAQKLSLEKKVQIMEGDVLTGGTAFSALPKADAIISNPPYIRAEELAGLQREVQKEPRMALDGGPDGLDFYRCFAKSWTSNLKDGGFFAFECGEGQGRMIASLFEQAGLTARVEMDFNGFDRYVFALKNRKDLL